MVRPPLPFGRFRLPVKARAVGDEQAALRRVESAWKANPAAPALASELIQAYARRNEIELAEAVLETFRVHGPPNALAQVANALPKRE